MNRSTPGFLSITNSRSLLRLIHIELVMPSNHLILCCPLLLPPSSILPSIRVFSNESVLCIRWPKHWSFSFSISPSNEYSGLISFGIDWLDLLAVQGTLKNLLQHHSSKASALWFSSHIHTGLLEKPLFWLYEPLLGMIKTISKKKKSQKAKWLSEEALKIAEKRREAKGKGEKER